MFCAEGRIVIRPKEDGKGDLILGSMFPFQSGLLKPGRVYEIRNILDTLTITDVGPAAIGSDYKTSMLGYTNWCRDVNSIITSGGGTQFLTRDEYERLR